MNGGYDGPGRYLHYKGGLYDVVGLGRMEHDHHEAVVVYKPVDGWPKDVHKADFWVRPLADFNMKVLLNLKPSDKPHTDMEGDAVPRFQRVRPITALYFGTSGGRAGHYWKDARGRSVLHEVIEQHVPWGAYVDGKLYPKASGGTEEQGVCAIHYKDGWTAIAFANRLDDSRGGCNSNFFFDATLTFEQAVEEARRQFPWIMERIDQAFELRLPEDNRGVVPA